MESKTIQATTVQSTAFFERILKDKREKVLLAYVYPF